MYAYCLFCRTGQEKAVVQKIAAQFGGIYALAVEKERHQKSKGIRTVVRDVVLPGYVMLYTMEELAPNRLKYMDGLYRLLKNADGKSELMGTDLQFAQWVFENGGLIKTSLAYREGTRVHILDGPLKTLEGKILRIDVRSRCCQVQIPFANREVNIWLSFDFVEADSQRPLRQEA